MSLRRSLVAILLLVFLGSLIYGFNLKNGLFWDDNDWIVNNPTVHVINWQAVQFWFSHNVLAGVGLTSNYYRPVLFSTFALNYVISGTNPISYHLFSNALHIINALLIFWLFGSVLKNKYASFIAALFFLVHPIATEAVTYISGRGDPLSVFWMLASLSLFYLSETQKLRWPYWARAASIIALVLALLSRETAIVFPFLALTFAISFIESGGFISSVWGGLKRTWPYFLVVLGYGISRLTILNFDNTLNFYSTPNVYSENLHVRLFTFMHVLWDYAQILVLPIHLHMDRSVTIHLSFFDLPVWSMATVLISGLAWLIWLYRQDQAGPLFRLWFFVVSWFFIALGPMSGITPINAQIYEHWLYLPGIAVFLLIGYYGQLLFAHLSANQKTLARLTLGGLVIYVSWLSFQSIQRNILWGKPIEFYEDILKYEPNSVRIRNNLGNQYYGIGDTEKAEQQYRAAIKLEDIFPQPHFNLGTILESRNDLKGAIEEYNKAVAIKPSFYYPYQNLASLYARQGDLVNARDALEKLQKIRSTDPVVYYSLAAVLRAQGNYAAAKMYAQEGLHYALPGTKVREALDLILTQLGK